MAHSQGQEEAPRSDELFGCSVDTYATICLEESGSCRSAAVRIVLPVCTLLVKKSTVWTTPWAEMRTSSTTPAPPLGSLTLCPGSSRKAVTTQTPGLTALLADFWAPYVYWVQPTSCAATGAHNLRSLFSIYLSRSIRQLSVINPNTLPCVPHAVHNSLCNGVCGPERLQFHQARVDVQQSVQLLCLCSISVLN